MLYEWRRSTRPHCTTSLNTQHASADVERMILGNKCDMDEKRVVSKERGEQLAVEYGVKFMETSAKSSINVEEVRSSPLSVWCFVTHFNNCSLPHVVLLGYWGHNVRVR